MSSQSINQETRPKNENGEPLRRYSFAKIKRLVRNSQFKDVLDGGFRTSNGVLTLYMAKNEYGHSRLGVSVGKAWGGAVARNRLKRLMREAFRQSQDRIPAGFDYVLMISQSLGKPDKSATQEAVKQLTFEQIRSSLLGLINQLSQTEDKTVK